MRKCFLFAAALSISVSSLAKARVDEVVGTARSYGEIVFISNIKSEKDENQNVTIDYNYNEKH